MEHNSFPVIDFEAKLRIEGTPGFQPSMYRHIVDGGVNWYGVAKDVYQIDHSRDHLVFKLMP